MNRLYETLAINYGKYLIGKVTDVNLAEKSTQETWQPWTSRLFERERGRFRYLRSVWTVISVNEKQGEPAYLPLEPISLNSNEIDHKWQLNPGQQKTDFEFSAQKLGKLIVQECEKDKAPNFERFYFLMQKFASNLPCTYLEEGVSLFQQWRMVTAVMAMAQGDTPDTLPEKLALIGIDLPGIQETVYTITSRVAGKSVRGRSAFIQLLVNAIVDRIVRELRLCRANVIVNAGGNALIVAGWSEQLDDQLRSLDSKLNRLLLYGDNPKGFTGFQGDLALALAWVEMPWRALYYSMDASDKMDDEANNSVSHWQFYEGKLKEKLGEAKRRPFAGILNDEIGFSQLFQVDAISSSRYCIVCRRPENTDSGRFTGWEDDESDVSATEQIICPVCRSFRALAEDLGKDNKFFIRLDQRPRETEVWQEGLYAMSGYWYAIDTQPSSQGLTLALSPDDFPRDWVDGFWPMATTTPLGGDGKILDNQQLADQSPSTFRRIGILKADVDNLARILVNGLANRRSAALTATLSESLTLFFGGWLDKICAEELFKNKVYVLYAGGDDLLLLGTWDVMPKLAQRIAEDFERYTGHNPGVHLSAGISIVGGKEPLHAAIDDADAALKRAKRYPNQRTPHKQAISFMEQVFTWEQFRIVQERQAELQGKINQGAPTSLLTTLLSIYQQYIDDQKSMSNRTSGYWTQANRASLYHHEGRPYELHLGPWLWQMIYKLHRLSNEKFNPQTIKELQAQLLEKDGLRTLAVGARWTALLTRKKEEVSQWQERF